MPALAELQNAMARALLAADPAVRQLPGEWFAGDAERGLHTHRNNILGACSNALRLSYPTLEHLIGEAAFDALAADFARQAPPTAPMLAVYGEAFAGHAAARAAAADRLLVEEVARFDWLFERIAQATADEFSGRAQQLAGGAQLQLCSSLRLFSAHYPVDALRSRTCESAEPQQQPCQLALWRRTAGVAVQPLAVESAAFLAALLADKDIDAALEAAAAASTAAGAADAAATTSAMPAAVEALPALIEREVLRASFVRLTAN
jgi:hypothetical protein